MNIFRCRELKIKCKKLPTKGSYNKQTLYLISYIYQNPIKFTDYLEEYFFHEQ